MVQVCIGGSCYITYSPYLILPLPPPLTTPHHLPFLPTFSSLFTLPYPCFPPLDTKSVRYDVQSVTTLLQKNNIVCDSVTLGKEHDNAILQGISLATKGYCFNPSTLKEALSIFELETVLSLGVRAPIPAQAFRSRPGQNIPYHTALTANRREEPMLTKRVTTLDIALGLPMVNGSYGHAGGSSGTGQGTQSGSTAGDDVTSCRLYLLQLKQSCLIYPNLIS